MRNTQRLDKLISNSGYGTRKEIKQVLKDGLIRVDGSIVKDGSTHVDPISSVIEINGEVLKYREFMYVMMNKPEGVISATFDNKLKTVIDLLPDKLKNFDLFPIGRLDIDTVGLLILTNDGPITHEFLLPKKHVPKRYYAKVQGIVTEEDGTAFKNGVILEDGYKTLPAELFILNSGEVSEIELVIFEGKFHQVKRMFEAVNKKVVFLKRIEMGPLLLDQSIEEGQCRELTEEEINWLLASVM